MRHARRIAPVQLPADFYEGTVFESPALLPGDLFMISRNCEFEFAFRLSSDIAARSNPYSEAEVARAVDSLLPAIEIGFDP